MGAIWNEVGASLKGEIGAGTYKSWIAPLRLVSLEGRVATFEVASAFVGSWIQSNFGDVIRRQFFACGHGVERLAFAVAARPAAPADPMDALAEVPAEAPRTPAPEAGLEPHRTFEAFVTGRPNELAANAARRVARGEPTGFNPLFLKGGVGLGKTHLMQAIAWELRAARPEANVVYLSAERFMWRFIQALRARTTLDFKEVFRSVDVLMIDDIQFVAGKTSTQEEFYHTLDVLLSEGRQVVLSADRAPAEIEGLDERVASRLQSGLTVDLHPTDYALRLGILNAKIAERTARGGAPVAPGVAELLAKRISSNVRVLEGALNRLFATAEMLRCEIDLPMTADCLADLLRSQDHKLSVEEIQRRVAEHYDIALDDLLGPRRARAVARPRQVAMYLCKRLTTRSLPDIGRRFGGRDHTTIIHGVRRIEELTAEDARLAGEVEQLRRALEA